jgi:outer membrane receptor protein involved in Fe transport
VTYGKRLVYTPDLRINLSIKAGNENRGLSLKYSYTGEQYSTVDNLIEPLPAFDSLDAEAYYGVRLGRFGLMAGFKLMNILDKRYEIYAYTPQPGRNWTASLRLTYSSPMEGSKSAE